jgi:hypothetical protein
MQALRHDRFSLIILWIASAPIYYTRGVGFRFSYSVQYLHLGSLCFLVWHFWPHQVI